MYVEQNKVCKLDIKIPAVYHGLSPETTGASTVTWFWGLMIGCILGLGF
jgi:hypothetical protein